MDSMEPALVPHEHTDFVSTNRLGYGWTYKKLADWLTNRELVLGEEVYIEHEITGLFD